MKRESHINRHCFWWYTPDAIGGFWTTAINFWPPLLRVEYMSAKSREFYRTRFREIPFDTPEYWAERNAACSDDTAWYWPQYYG